MVYTIFNPMFQQILNILETEICDEDVCKVYFDNNFPFIFCDKGNDNIQTIKRDEMVLASFMFTFDTLDRKIGCHLYMDALIDENTAHYVLRSFLNSYRKISENRSYIIKEEIVIRIHNMKSMPLLSLDYIKNLSSNDYSQDVDKKLSQL